MKTIFEQTGWKRPYPQMICQDPDVLMNISDFTFKLSDREFIKYFINRTGICIGTEDNPKLARFLLGDPDAVDWMRSSPDFVFENGEKLSREDRQDQIRINQIMRGRLQDAWELYCRKTTF